MANERRIVELVLKAVGDQQLKAITRDLVALKQSAQASQTALDGITGQLNAFGGAAISALKAFGIVETLKEVIGVAGRAIDQMDELSVTISKVGVAAGDLQKLQYAANLSNVGLDDLNKGLVKLSVNMTDLQGKNSAATATLRELGITAKTGTLEAMQKLADKFASMPDGANKTALAVQLFGKSGAELIPLLNAGSQGLGDMADEATKLGIVLSGQALAAANDFNDELDKMSGLVGAAIKALVGGMAPALLTVAGEFEHAMTTGEKFEDMGRRIGDMLISVSAQLASAKTYIAAFAASVDAMVAAYRHAWEGGNLAGAGRFEEAGKAFSAARQDSAAIYSAWGGIAQRADAAKKSIQDAYQANLYRTRLEGRLLDARGGGGKLEGTAGADAKAASAAAAKAAREAAAAKREQEKAAREAAKAAKAEADAIADLNLQIAANNQLMGAHFAENAKLADEYNRAADPLIEYQQGLSKLEDAKKSLMLTDAAYAQEQERLLANYKEATLAIWRNDESVKAQKEHLEKVKEQWGFVADAMAEATYSIIAGTESVGQAMRRMVATIIAEALKLQLMKAADKIFGKVFGDLWDKFLPSAAGNAFGSAGVISTPTLHGISGGGIGIAGEAGPEAIMPLTRTASGQLGVAASGAAANVTVNNYAGADIATRQTDQGLQIDVMRRQLADDIRRGGNSVSAALEGTYRVGRYAGAYA